MLQLSPVFLRMLRGDYLAAVSQRIGRKIGVSRPFSHAAIHEGPSSGLWATFSPTGNAVKHFFLGNWHESMSFGPNPASRRLRPGLETTTTAPQFQSAPPKALCRWTEGLETTALWRIPLSIQTCVHPA